MARFDNACIKCGCSDPSKLNTVIQLKHEGKSYPVALCDDHEDLTPKQTRALVAKRLTEIEAALATLRAAGMSVSDAPGLTVVEAPKPAPVQESEPEQEPEPEPKPKPQVNRKVIKARSVSGVATGEDGSSVEVASHTELDPESIIAEEVGEKAAKKIQSQVVKTGKFVGRAGSEIEIPSQIRDNMGGSTDIIIVPSDNNVVKRRFEAIVAASEGTSHKTAGYGMVACPLCRSSGVRRVRGNATTCPKCQGRGFVN